MLESPEDLHWLEELLARSHARMNPHMRSILTPERALGARQVVTYLQGIKHVAVATVNRAGDPRIAPVDALFVRGRFHLGTGGAAARVAHLRRRAGISLTHFAGDELAITVHGTATLIGREHVDARALEPVFRDAYGSSPFEWAEQVVLIRVEPALMYAYAPHPERYPTGTEAPARPRPMRLVPARKL